jgi:hypothetical protein
MKIFLLGLALFFCLNTKAQSSVQRQTAVSFPDFNSHPVFVDSFQNKKMLVILLPAMQDSAMTRQILRFQARHSGKINILALVEASPGAAVADSLQNVYALLSGSGIVVSEGMTFLSTDPGKREALVNWLTTKSRNRKAEMAAAGRKYFVSEDGQLYGILGPETSLDMPMADFLVNTQIPVTRHP